MIRKTGIAFTLPVPSQFCLLSLAVLVLGGVAARAGSRADSPKSAREPSGKAAPNVAPAVNRTPRGIEPRIGQAPRPGAATRATGSSRNRNATRCPAALRPATTSINWTLADAPRSAHLRRLPQAPGHPPEARDGSAGADRIPFTYEAVGTIAFDDPPAVVPNGTNWDVSLRLALKETCSIDWSEAAAAITARLGSLPPARRRRRPAAPRRLLGRGNGIREEPYARAERGRPGLPPVRPVSPRPTASPGASPCPCAFR